MTIKELSDKELTLVSSLVKQNKNKLEEIITGARKVNDLDYLEDRIETHLSWG